jgi:hypothetical protein
MDSATFSRTGMDSDPLVFASGTTSVAVAVGSAGGALSTQEHWDTAPTQHLQPCLYPEQHSQLRHSGNQNSAAALVSLPFMVGTAPEGRKLVDDFCWETEEVRVGTGTGAGAATGVGVEVVEERVGGRPEAHEHWVAPLAQHLHPYLNPEQHSQLRHSGNQNSAAALVSLPFIEGMAPWGSKLVDFGWGAEVVCCCGGW